MGIRKNSYSGPKLRAAPRWTMWLLVVVSTLAVGVIAGSFFAGSLSRQENLSTAKSIELVPYRFDDSRSLRMTMVSQKPVTLYSPRDGVVTRTSCAGDEPWTSGTSPLELNGDPILALSTAVPLWRDLSGGERGADVEALQKELNRLGYPTGSSGQADTVTLQAWIQLQKAAGATKTVPYVAIDRVLFLPQATATLADCAVSKGQRLPSNAPLATIRSGPMALTSATLPSDLAAGERVFDFGGMLASAGEPRITDPAILDQIMALETVKAQLAAAEAMSDKEQVEIPVKYVLKEPLDAFAVPPAALHRIDGTSACLFDADAGSGDSGTRVQIVSSSLGRSIVTLPKDHPAPHHVALADQPDQSCK